MTDNVITVPFAQIDKVDKNNRIYSMDFFEKAIKEKLFNGQTVTIPNFDNDGSFKNICGVIENLKIEENTVFADIKLVGPYGTLIKQINESSGKVGFNFTGYGHLKETDSYRILDSDDFELANISIVPFS